MTRDQAITAAQSALRLRHGVTHNNNGVWSWRRFGWNITMWENGNLVSAHDEWAVL